MHVLFTFTKTLLNNGTPGTLHNDAITYFTDFESSFFQICSGLDVSPYNVTDVAYGRTQFVGDFSFWAEPPCP